MEDIDIGVLGVGIRPSRRMEDQEQKAERQHGGRKRASHFSGPAVSPKDGTPNPPDRSGFMELLSHHKPRYFFQLRISGS
jgi:hypothetical protein